MKFLSPLLTVPALTMALVMALPAPGLADSHAAIATSIDAASLPEKKQTKAGLYLSATEAAEALTANPDMVLIDVRTPEETMLIGYPVAAAANIPFKQIDPGHGYLADKQTYAMLPNGNFVTTVKAFLAQNSEAKTLLVMCRSGSRSAGAVNALVDAGIDAQIYNVVDGFEGDMDDAGRRTVNGWKNAGHAWTYKIDPGFLFTAE